MKKTINKDQPSRQVLSKATLLERIHHYSAILEGTLDGLSDSQLTKPGPEKWAVKDHLAHLAVWETGVVELLQKRPRFAAMGVEQAFEDGRSEDEINDLIYRQHRDLPLSEVMIEFKQAHQSMLELLEKLTDEDLHKPYSDYVPGGDPARQDPVMYWVIGNTYAHFDEHNVYIQALLEAG